MNIGQIAVLVGYTKPSNFSAAFKKKYGVMPKDYREASRIKQVLCIPKINTDFGQNEIAFGLDIGNEIAKMRGVVRTL